MLHPMATSTLDSTMHLTLGPWGTWCPVQPPTATCYIREGQTRTAALFNTPENVICLSPGHGHHHAVALRGETFPIFHPRGHLDTTKLSRHGFDVLHSLALLIKRTFVLFSVFLFVCFLVFGDFFPINSHVLQQNSFYKG